MIPPSTKFGYRLRTLRQDLGLTQAELAKKTRIAQETISRLESGRHKQPDMETVLTIAQVLGVSIDYFFK